MYDPTQDKDLIKMIGNRLVKIDPACDVEPSIDVDATWYLSFGEGTREDQAHVDYYIMNSCHWDGSEGEEGGYNAGWIACWWGGGVLAQCTPYNYTNRVWTRDRDELWKRAEGTLDALEEWVATKGWED